MAQGAEFLERLEAVLSPVAAKLAGTLPDEGNRSVWVVPFGDDRGGVTRLGALAAERLGDQLIERGVFLVERDKLDHILREKKLSYLDFMRQTPAGSLDLKVIPAAFLITGKMATAGNQVSFSVRLIPMGSARVVATAQLALRRGSVPADLFAYVQRPKHQPDKPVSVPPMEIRFHFFAQRRTSAGVEEVRVTSGGTMRSRDQFRLQFAPVSDCYVYLLLYGSDGKAVPLFPNKSPEFDIHLDNFCRGGVRYVVPDGGRWYWLDDNPGLERLYVVASYEPRDNIDGLLKQVEAAAGDEQARLCRGLEDAIKQLKADDGAGRIRSASLEIGTRGVGGTAYDTRYRPQTFTLGDGRKITRIGEVLRGQFAVVKELVIRHVR